MPNVVHSQFILDENHAKAAVIYADIAARDADTAFQVTANLDKEVKILSPLSYYNLAALGPVVWLEMTNITAGNVTTSDTLLATQLLLGNGGEDIVTEPNLVFAAGILTITGDLMVNDITLGVGSFINMEGGIVLFGDGAGNVQLENINTLDSTTKTTIETTILTLTNLTMIGFTSGNVAGPSGAWDDGGFDLGANNSYDINGTALLSDSAGTITLSNINVMDATTQATILAIPGIGNVTTSDTLLATQLLLGNGTDDIVTEPNLVFALGVLTITGDLVVNGSQGITLGASSSINMEGEDVLFGDGVGGVALQNIDAIDSTTKTTIETAILTLTNLTMIGFTSGSVLGPSGVWDDGGMNLGGNDSYEINGTALLSDSGGTITLSNIDALDATTEATILAISGLGNVTTSDTLTANQLLLGNGGKDIVTEPNLVWDGVMFGIGIPNPISRCHVKEDNALINQDAGVTIEQAGTGDALLQFLATGVQRWIMGIDNSDSMSFKIQSVLGLSGDAEFTITTAGDFGFGVTNPGTKVDIKDVGNDALRLRSGNATGDALNQIKFSLDGGLLYTHAIKTLHHATNQFDNHMDFYLWNPDEDAPTDVGTMSVLHLQGNGKIGVNMETPSSIFDITSDFGDTTPVISMESLGQGGIVKLRVGNRNPNGTVTGAAPDIYFHDLGALSGTYENRSPTTDQVWFKHSVNPPETVEFLNSTELDALASGGIITISTNTNWVIKAPLTTANRIVVNSGIFFIITAEFSATASITYTGTDTFLTSAGAVGIFAQAQLISSSTGTFIDQNGGALSFKESSLVGWDDLGAIINAPFFVDQGRFVNIGSGFTLTNNNICTFGTFVFAGAPLNGPLFTINTNNPASLYSFTDVSAFALGATGSLLDLDTRINTNAVVTITRSAIPTGNLFKPSVLTDATINSVADGSPTTGTITAMADNGSGGTTISSTTTYFEDEEVTITGTTSYNGIFQIFNVVAGVSFDIITAFVADDATGSVDSVRLTLSLAGGHGISTGDSIKVIDTNFYNGFATTLNVVSDDITINGVFISTNAGSIERELSVDQTDRRVNSFDNQKASNSHSIACGHVNDNSTANGAIINNTFTDQVFGTVGAALIASSTMELWRLFDEINGIFEYFGVEEFDGFITFDFTVVSSGGSVDFRFKWELDSGSGFADLPDNVESLVNVGSDAQSVTKTFPLRAQFGDRVRPQITRNSGNSGITTSYATIYATQ